MSTHEVLVRRLHIEEHPNADRLEIGVVDGYRFIIQKGHVEGEYGAYIPEQSLLPQELITEMELDGLLAGAEKNRVKAIRLRGELSQGLWYPLSPGTAHLLREGDNVANLLGITKYEPPIPQQLQGKVRARPVGPARDFWLAYDMENIKTYPDVFQPGEPVSITEKLHGTLLLCALIDGEEVISSKGLASRNLIIEEDEGNTYWRAAREYGLFEKLRSIGDGENIILFGEIVGVQDLKYGTKNGHNAFYAFDLYDGQFQDPLSFRLLCAEEHIPTVPLLYEGPFDPSIVEVCTTGTSTLAGHIREGCVVKSLLEHNDPRLGRAILKSVSADYLLRKGNATEWN